MDLKKKMDCTENLKFVEGITSMIDSIFNTPESESEVALAPCNRKQEQKREIFDKLYHATSLHIQQMEEDIIVE